MTWEALATLLIIAAILIALARNLGGADVVFMGAVALLGVLGLFSRRFPSPRELAGVFGNEGLLTVAVLYVVAAGLTETGALALVTGKVFGRPRSLLTTQLRMIVPVAGLSAFLNNTPVVAMFVPALNEWRKKTGISASKLFMPLSYAAILGGTCTLIGTSTNLVVRGLMEETRALDPTLPQFGMWTISLVGVPVGLVGLVYILVASRALLPDRDPMQVALSDPREYTVEMMIEKESPLDGQTVSEAGLDEIAAASLIEIQRDGEIIPAVEAHQVLREGDRLIFAGVIESVAELQRLRGLVPASEQVFKLQDPREQRCLVEAVLSQTHPMIGDSVGGGKFRARYGAAVIAVHRNGRRIDKAIREIALEPGDTLLLETHPRFLERYHNSSDFLLVSAVADSTPRRHHRAWIALAILGVVVLLLALEQLGVSVFVAALLGAVLMLLFRCCSLEQARRAIDWPTLIAIGASFAVGKAMETTGAAGVIADQTMLLFRAVPSQWEPFAALAGIYLVTLLFTELVTNNAAAALAFPIAHLTAQSLDVNFLPFAIAVAIGASAGFVVPAGYATHMMVNAPGGYRFGDWVRFGLPLDVIIMVSTVIITPLVFPF